MKTKFEFIVFDICLLDIFPHFSTNFHICLATMSFSPREAPRFDGGAVNHEDFLVKLDELLSIPDDWRRMVSVSDAYTDQWSRICVVV